METYSFLRQFADSWGMLVMFGIFVGVVFWAFRPGSRKVHDFIADTPFRNEDKPAPAVPTAESAAESTAESTKEDRS